MKISHEMQKQTEPAYKRPVQQNTLNFSKIVQSQTQSLKQQELNQLVKDITMQGNKLARYRTFKELAKFKRMVKGFLQETVKNGYSLQKSHTFGFSGESRQLTLLEEVDLKLVELTEEIMNQERKTVDILGLIGEIKGLLINIYM